MRRPERQRAGGSGRQRRGLSAFTLVELLVVISIILILIGILVPTITNAIREGYATKTLSYINKNLVVGADSYKQQIGHYPGQDTETRAYLENGNTGSQILAACLFAYYEDTNPDANPCDHIDSTNITDPDTDPSPDPERAYASYKKEYLATIQDKANTLADGFPGPKAMAILYYPSHREIDTGVPRDQFQYVDNKAYMTEDTCDSEVYSTNDTTAQSNLRDKITDSGFSGTPLRPYNDGQYLLVGAGVGRKYFDDDDLTNF